MTSSFTDVFSLNVGASIPSNCSLDETDIALPADRHSLYKQVQGFQSAVVANQSVS